MERAGKSEGIIQDTGCGLFQAIHFISVTIVSYGAVAFTIHFMSFGNYNPGWRCLDTNGTFYHDAAILNNNSSNSNNGTLDTLSGRLVNGLNLNETLTLNSSNNKNDDDDVASHKYKLEDCPAFIACQNIEFNPEASTIVTEWGLVCDRAWIPSFIISLQMGGILIGSSAAGVLGDAYGRKFVIYTSFVFTLIFNVISTFSNSWQMLAALRFLLGMSMSFPVLLCYVYVAEFVPRRWRAIVLGMPYYPLTVVFFGVTCLILKDWRHIQIAICFVSLFAIAPAFWLPESLRWLEVKNKKEKFETAALKVAKYNRKKLQIQFEEQLNLETQLDDKNKQTIKDMLLSTLKLFGKEYRKYTLLVSVPWCSVSLLYYAIAFGVKAFGGNFYLNLIIYYGIEVFLDAILMFAPNVFGRKLAGFVFSIISGICLLMAACFQELGSDAIKTYGIAALVMFGRISISCFWIDLQILMVEIYPTEARGAANSWGMIMSRVGGIIAPLLIPTAADTMFICYAVMGVLALVCASIVLLLPETKGKPLAKSFKQDGDDGHEGGGTVA